MRFMCLALTLLAVPAVADPIADRDGLQRLLFGQTLPLVEAPEEVEEDFLAVVGLVADRIKVSSMSGAVTYGYHFNKNGDPLVVVLQGHCPADPPQTLEDYGTGNLIRALVDAGASVLGMDMLGCGANTSSWTHNNLWQAEESMWLYHFRPIQIALEHALAQNQYASLSVMGLSGGGWLTTVFSAANPGVDLSIEVAGTMPLDIRPGLSDHIESRWLAELVSYRRLYRLGADSPGRIRVQILNPLDSCCFTLAEYGADYASRILALDVSVAGEIRFEQMSDPGQHRWDSQRIEYALTELGFDVDPPQPGDEIEVVNGSFEEPGLPPGGFQASFVGWTAIGVYGTYRPAVAAYPSGVPDGNQVAYAAPGTICQTVASAVTDGTYVLSVKAGCRLDKACHAYQVDLRVDGVVMASDSAPSPGAGQWVDAVASFTAAGLSGALEACLYGAGNQVNFDDVRVTLAVP